MVNHNAAIVNHMQNNLHSLQPEAAQKIIT